MSTASTIPYQLRPNKAVERNIFIALLRKISSHPSFNLSTYRYVGFGAPFLEDFKLLHNEFGLVDMDCMEGNSSAYSRQKFNQPYQFLNLYNIYSTDYITTSLFKADKSQIIWLDYAVPNQLHQQLLDLEMVGEKLYEHDILKFTFNASIKAFQDGYGTVDVEETTILAHMQNSSSFSSYVPLIADINTVKGKYGGLLRTMGISAINRGLRKQARSLVFKPVSSFQYADGQMMTTVTGIITKPELAESTISQISLNTWEFFIDSSEQGLLDAHRINVPAMTVAERSEIDKHLPILNVAAYIPTIPFSYETKASDNQKLIEGYCKYYRYLPYFGKVTF